MKELWQKFFSEQVDQIFLKVRGKNLEKVARIGEIMRRRDPPILRELSLKFRR